MLKLTRILIAASLLLLALAVGLSISPQQVSAAPHWIVTLTPTLQVTPTEVTATPPVQPPPPTTAPPTQTLIPSPTPTSGVFPPNQQTATATPEPEEEEEERSPTRTPQPVILPDTGELPPLGGGPSLYVIFAAGLAAGLALGLGLRKRLTSWFVRVLGVFVVLAFVGLSARGVGAPSSVSESGASQAAVSQGVQPF